MIRSQLRLIVALLASGCAHPHANLDETVSRRVIPPEIGAGTAASRLGAGAKDPSAKDEAVRPAAVHGQGEAAGVRPAADLAAPLPPALDRPPQTAESDRSLPAAATLPPDSDEAALDAVAAAGKPLTLADAVDAAFRFQPKLRAQLEAIAQARGLQQIAFSTFLPTVAANYDVGGYKLDVGGTPIKIGSLPGFNFIPLNGAVPIGLKLGTAFELAELKAQWLLLDFGRRLGTYEQARLANDVARFQTDRAFQTVANEVAIAYYNVLRSQALRKAEQDALRRAEEELVDARKREREGVVQREIVLRSEVQRAETLQQLHAVIEAEFVALAELNLAIGLKCGQPVRVIEPAEVPPLATSLAESLQTAVRARREFGVIRRSVEIAAQGGRVARADFAPKVIADGTAFDFQQNSPSGHADFALGFIRLDWTLFEGGRKIAATRIADSKLREAVAHAESITDQIAFQVNQAYRSAVTSWVGIEDARPAVDQARENYRLVQLRAREGAATSSEVTDALASLTRAEQNYLNARYSYLIARDRLDYAMGIAPTPATRAAGHP
jgi:outer membrane protein TolC